VPPGVIPGLVVPQAPTPAPSAVDEERTVRTQVFEKTKMCKFHILGACAKGSSCRFAHFPSELQSLPDLACTKLCKTLVSTGSCDNPECRYAHNNQELRPLPFDEGNPQAAESSGGVQFDGQGYPTHMVSALAQIGQAAQAHAAEAARLQALGSQLQAVAAASGPGASSPDAAPAYLGGGFGGMMPDASLVVKNTFLDFESKMPDAPLRTVASAAGRLCSLGGTDLLEDMPRSQSFDSQSVLEPVQINLSSLRSLSSNSLVTMGGEDNSDEWLHASPPPRSRTTSRHPTMSELGPLHEDGPMPVPVKASPLTKPSPEPGSFSEQDWLAATERANSSSLFGSAHSAMQNEWMEFQTSDVSSYNDVSGYHHWGTGTAVKNAFL